MSIDSYNLKIAQQIQKSDLCNQQFIQTVNKFQIMNWIALRKNNIPIVDRQVEKALKIYQQIQDSIMQGDILSIQKMSEFQLSVKIKKRIQQIDDFYNKNCLDQRVRFLQAARMKLSRILYQNVITQKESNINLPWKNTSDLSNSRQSNSSSKKMTPNKYTPKSNQINNQKQKNDFRKNSSKSPIRSQANYSKMQQQQNENKRKPIDLSLQIPNDDQVEELIAQNAKNQDQKNKKSSRTSRKLQYIPKNKPNNDNTQVSMNKHQNSKPNRQRIKTQSGSNNQPKIKISQPPGALPVSSRSKLTNVSAKSKGGIESSNTNSMRKLNDLIFTIKMTKEQYQDFVEVKKKLNNE